MHFWLWKMHTLNEMGIVPTTKPPKRANKPPSSKGSMSTTHQFVSNQPSSKHWKFCPNWSICSKDIQHYPQQRHTDAQYDRHTNESPLYHIQVQVNFFSTLFSTFSLTMFAHFVLSLRFIQDNLNFYKWTVNIRVEYFEETLCNLITQPTYTCLLKQFDHLSVA